MTTTVPAHRRRGAPAKKALHRPRPADCHEVQADHAADAAVRGASDLAGTLTPAPAASVHVASIGSPLPAPVRDRLERSFGADLDEVRVHHGAAAAAANRAEHARAFAAGRDIFFGDGAFAPHTEVGYRLLAHEVAHVLQQTGRRRGAARRLAASVAPGTGLPQYRKLEDLDLTLAGNAELKKLADEHRALYARSDVELEHMIEHVVDLLLPAKIDFPLATRTTVGDTLRDEANKGVDGKTAPPRGFLADCLKLMQPPGATDYYDAVLAIYDADAAAKKAAYTIRTRRDSGFLTYLQTAKKGHEEWAAAAAENHKRLRNFWLPSMFEIYVQAVTSLWGTPAPLWGTDEVDGGKGHSWKDEVTLLDSITTPDFTERELLAASLIIGLDKSIQQQLGEFFADAQKRAANDLVGQRLVIAEDLGLSSKANKADPKLPAYLQPFWDKLIKLADNATRMWKAAKGLAGGGALDTVSEMPALATLLVDAAKDLVAPGGDGTPPLPKPAEFAARLASLKEALIGDNPGIDAKRPPANKGDPRRDSLLAVVQRAITAGLRAGKSPPPALAALAGGIYQLTLAIDKYKVSDDVGGYRDLRDFHRYHIAGLVLALGGRLKTGAPGKVDELHTVLDPVRDGEGVDRLVISGDWKAEDAEPERMIDDLGPARKPLDITEDPTDPDSDVLRIPLTVRQLVYIFRLAFYNELNAGYQTILDGLDAQRTLGLISASTQLPQPQALQAARAAIKQPTRWTPSSALFIPAAPKSSILSLYTGSQKTVDQISRGSAAGSTGIYPDKLTAIVNPIYAWVVPPLDGLIAWIKGDAVIQAMIIAAAARPIKTDHDWLVALADAWTENKIARLKDPKAADLVHLLFERIVNAKGGLVDAQKQLVDRERQIEIYFRRISVARIREPLHAYTADRHAYNLGQRDKAMKELFDFTAHAPYLRRDDQLVLLMLELAPDFDDAFDSDDHIDISINPYLIAALAGSLDTADKPLSRFLGVPKKGVTDPAAKLVDDQAELDTLLANRPRLEKLKQRLDEARKRLQNKFGIRSVDGVTLQGYVFGDKIEPKDEFMIDGIAYMLVKVHRPFIFHPGVHEPAPTKPIYKDKEDGSPLSPSGQALFTIIAIEGDTPGSQFANQITDPGDLWAEKYKGRLDDEGKPLTSATDVEPERFVVTDRHVQMLGHLSYVVEMRANQIGLEATAEVIEFASQIIITAAEILLPGGQVIGIAETMASVAMILDDPDMRELLAELFDDPKTFFSKIWDKIKEGFSLSGLIDLLLGAGKFASWLDVLAGLTGRDDSRPKVKSQPTGMFGRVVRFIVNLGRKLAEIFRKARHLLRGPLGRLHAAVVTRPKLAWFIDTAVDLTLRAVEYLYDHPAVLDIATDITAWVHDSLVGFLKTIEQIELPREIIPMDQVIAGGLAFLIDFIIGKIPKLKLLKPILKATGLDVKIAEKINSVFHLDQNDVVQIPNRLYRDFVDENINPAFTRFRNAVVDDLVELINFGSDKLKLFTGLDVGQVKNPGHQDVKPSQADMLSAYPADGESPDATTAEIPKVAGRPLDDDMRIAVEKAFGQDFGHVRMHGDAPADRMARKLGAHALTTGSHVYVRSDLDLASPFGRRVLDHELAHVIQQTGTRPLGQGHGATATTPPPAAQLSLDIHKEAAAEQLAAAATGTGQIPSQLKATGDLLQPFTFDPELITKIVGTVTHLNGEGDFEERPVPGEEVQGKDKAAAVWSSFKTTLRSKGQFAPFMASVKDSVIDQLVERSEVKPVDIEKVAELAQTTLPRAQQTDDVRTKLDVKHFATLLEGFLYARCGVVVQISGPDDKSTDVTEIKVVYLHLALVGGTSKLWKTVMADVMTDTELTKLDSDKDGLQRELRRRLADLGPQAFIWDSGAFKLSAGFLKDFVALKAMRAVAGKPTEVPPAAQYAKIDTTESSSLRLGTHGTIRKGGIGKFARESHHTTQFLLVEYFRNRVDDPDLKAFPTPFTSYQTALGIASSDSKLIDSVDGKNLAKLDPGSGRGDGMPAILIAAETHRKARLHINTSDKADDDPDAKPEEPDQGSGQGATLATWFRAKLSGTLVAAHKSGDGAEFGKAIKADPTAKIQIHAGMRYAYERMYESHMLGRLTAGLKTIERAYYEGIAARSHTKDDQLDPAYQLTNALLDPIIAKAESNNRAAFDKEWK